jgi:hypothetical protein
MGTVATIDHGIDHRVVFPGFDVDNGSGAPDLGARDLDAARPSGATASTTGRSPSPGCCSRARSLSTTPGQQHITH